MKRTGFLAAVGGAIAAAATRLPKLPAPLSFRSTFGTQWVRNVGGRLFFGGEITPTVLVVSPQIHKIAREILGSEPKPF